MWKAGCNKSSTNILYRKSRHCDRHNNDCVSYSEEKLGCKWVAKLLANATASRLMQFKYCTQSHQLMRGMIIELG